MPDKKPHHGGRGYELIDSSRPVVILMYAKGCFTCIAFPRILSADYRRVEVRESKAMADPPGSGSGIVHGIIEPRAEPSMMPSGFSCFS